MNSTDEKRIAEVLSRFEGVQAVYIFGSAAQEGQRPDSDLDLAVVPRDESVRKCKLDMLQELARAGFDDVDLVFIDGRDAVLRFHAVRQNELLYQTPDFDHPGYFSRTLREYFDLQPYLSLHQAAYRKKVLGD